MSASVRKVKGCTSCLNGNCTWYLIKVGRLEYKNKTSGIGITGVFGAPISGLNSGGGLISEVILRQVSATILESLDSYIKQCE